MSVAIAAAGAEAAGAFAVLHAEGAFEQPWDAPAFAALLSTPGAFGLLAGLSPPAGLLVGWVAADEAEILTLLVAGDRRRQGLGAGLLRAAIAEAGRRGARRIMLEAAADNAAAHALYAGFGFREAGVRRGYYRRPEGFADARILRLDLAPPG